MLRASVVMGQLCARNGLRGKATYRLVATDLDGTFMRDQGRLPWKQSPSPRNTAAVRELLHRGVYFVPISGRQIPTMAPLVRAMGDDVATSDHCFIAGINGGVVTASPGTAAAGVGDMLSSRALHPEVVQQALAFAEANELLTKFYYVKNGVHGMARSSQSIPLSHSVCFCSTAPTAWRKVDTPASSHRHHDGVPV